MSFTADWHLSGLCLDLGQLPGSFYQLYETSNSCCEIPEWERNVRQPTA
jgi:hypothetical protein